MKIAIFSSWKNEITPENKKITMEIAEYLAKEGITVLTGGCSGIPALAVATAHKHLGDTEGYFPHGNPHEFVNSLHEENIDNADNYSHKHFIAGFTARSLRMIQDADAAIVLNGRIGTLSEFGMAIEEGLPMAVIEGTGGIADELRNMVDVAQREFPNNEVIFESDYKKAIGALIAYYQLKGIK